MKPSKPLILKQKSTSSDITLRCIAIQSHLKWYRLAHFINLYCDLDLVATGDFAQISADVDVDNSYLNLSAFFGKNEIDRYKYIMVGNIENNWFSINGYKFNYMLILCFDDIDCVDDRISKEFINAISKANVDGVKLCFDVFEFDIKTLYNYKNFLAKYELYILNMLK